MIFKVSLLLCVVGFASSFPADAPRYRPQAPSPPQYQQPIQEQSRYEQPEERSRYDETKQPAPRPYQFDYGVRDDYTGANFGHQEESDGNQIKGSYTVALPDGRIQTVTYVADHINGFQAKVTYEGEASYDEAPRRPQYKSEPQQEQYESQPQRQQYRPQPQQQYKAAPSRSQYRSETRIEQQYSNLEDENPFQPIADISALQYTEDSN